MKESRDGAARSRPITAPSAPAAAAPPPPQLLVPAPPAPPPSSASSDGAACSTALEVLPVAASTPARVRNSGVALSTL